ncbi:hypothetical protein PGTUg99_036282 [Puccinia graminis f. sp. tritici]|uniref:HMG box domain-containing protein n=3 Tax=Puccinia graminis f. sp. tritici TaxID=56615 RepID=E3KTE9_PUCGT|nr:uncharacterized protein PGTG_13945 [Puccinia graminis f. sp. tritici CRL 75-36-700-3]EFP87574.2 hypothetical protein PGTG_13945 [Puccinia graminis f. sp. tritici CRL 75-36-700-3]KAA1090137.1 hypothetical protein PGTUg99_036282 [Puccinia graminis f. sp. tritici]
MAHSSKESLLAAKQDLLAAYSSVHNALGRLINLVHSSEPRAVADALGSDYEQHHAQSPPQDLYPRGSAASQAAYGSRPPQYSEPQNYAHSHPPYPAPPQPQSSSNPRTSAPPGPSFMTVTPGAPRQQAHPPAQASKARHRKPQHPAVTQSYASQPAHPLETDDEDDDEDDPEEPVSEEDHPNGTGPFYNPPRQPTTIPTPPGSIPGGKKKRVKRERDPNAPKRPASAYILFQNAVRQEMRAANPTADYKELARQIGDRWKNLSEEAKRPWSEAGKLAMNSWNIQNKEYKTSHPEITSPHHQTGACPAPVPRKRRSRAAEVDAQGNPLPKKRGRPSKVEKDSPPDHPVHPVHLGGQPVQQPNSAMSLQTINGHSVPPAPQPHMVVAAQHAVQPQHHEEEYSEEGEEEEEVEEEEEEEEETANHYHNPQVAGQPSSMPPPQMNGPSQVSPQMAAHSESELEDGEEEEGSEARSPEPNHPVNKMAVQPNGILA